GLTGRSRTISGRGGARFPRTVMRAQRTLRNLHHGLHQNSWLSHAQRVDCHCAAVSAEAAPAPRSWVGRVRVVGAADVIDALGAWRAPGSPGFHRDSIEAAPLGEPPRTLSGADAFAPR